MKNEALITLTADIVAAHLSNNTVTPAEVSQLIERVYGAIAGLGQTAVVEEEPLAPAVSIRSSVKPSSITCLECGEKMKMLKRHLSTSHSMTPADYRARWDLSSDYPMVAPEYAARRAELAVKIGLGRNNHRGRKGSQAKRA